MMPRRLPSSNTGRNNMTVVAWVTAPAIRLMASSPPVERRRIMRVYLQVVVMIVGLLGAFVALSHLAA